MGIYRGKGVGAMEVGGRIRGTAPRAAAPAVTSIATYRPRESGAQRLLDFTARKHQGWGQA